MNNKILALMAVMYIISVGLLILAVGIDTHGSTLAKKYRKTQAFSQVNNCGNSLLPTNITCTNYNSNPEDHQSYSVSTTNPSLPPFP